MRRRSNNIPKLYLKKGDIVHVISGDDKGKSGQVLEVYPAENKIIVEGINVVKRHTKPNAKNTDGGIIDKELPVHISNVMLSDPKSGEPTKVARKFDESGKLVRYAKKSGEVIE